ncbi:MAG: hypothetical protein GX259_10485 [Bacteroidales bacterium]|nr:hypothetical protein [Bacteroidales bacterium]
MKKIFTLLFTFSLAHCVFAQKQFTQTVRGTVTSTDPESNIFSASVLVLGSDPLIGTITDEMFWVYPMIYKSTNMLKCFFRVLCLWLLTKFTFLCKIANL